MQTMNCCISDKNNNNASEEQINKFKQNTGIKLVSSKDIL